MGLAANMRQDVTYWPVTGSDGFGGFTFGSPVLLKGRWEEKQELFMTSTNEEVLSQDIVYLLSDVDIGDFLALGDFVLSTPDPTNLKDAKRVRQRNRSTDLRSLVALRKVYL